MECLRVCERLRRDATLAAVPILFLTARDAIEDRIKGLDKGGDDYLVKPFDLRELKARIRALLRRGRATSRVGLAPESHGSLLVLGPLTLDINTRRVRVDGDTRQLTPIEFDLLHYLMVHPGELFSSQELLQQVWGYAPATSDASLVRWHIKNLRTKIERNPAHPLHLRTVPHHGYTLSGA